MAKAGMNNIAAYIDAARGLLARHALYAARRRAAGISPGMRSAYNALRSYRIWRRMRRLLRAAAALRFFSAMQ